MPENEPRGAPHIEEDRDAIRAEQDRPRTISEMSARLIKESLVIDMTQPMALGNLHKLNVLEKARAAGFDFVSVTAQEHRSDVTAAAAAIGAVIRYVAERPDQLLYVRNCNELLRARAAGLTGVGVHFQDTDPVDGNLDLVWMYRELGVSHMLLAYNQRNRVADGCAEVTDSGLSRYGRDLIKEMRKVGILCDGAHSGRRATLEAMEVFEGPFIFSHSNCASVFAHYRNITDEQIKACAATGGVIGINGVGRFLDDPFASAVSMFRHVDHIVSLVGWEHVGIGLDRMADPDRMWQALHDRPSAWPTNNGRPLQFATFAPHTVVGEIVDLMLSRGYSEEAIKGYLGGNFLRVLKTVWR